MEARVLPELVLSRKVCESCGEHVFEFTPDTLLEQKYICINCST